MAKAVRLREGAKWSPSKQQRRHDQPRGGDQADVTARFNEVSQSDLSIKSRASSDTVYVCVSSRMRLKHPRAGKMLALEIQLDRKAPVTGNASTTPSAPDLPCVSPIGMSSGRAL